MNNQIFLIVDKNGVNSRKPFVAIAKNEKSAETFLSNRKKNLSEDERKLVWAVPVNVADYDDNKSNIYLVYNKVDKNLQNPIVGAFSKLDNATNMLNMARRKVSQYMQKQVFLQSEPLI